MSRTEHEIILQAIRQTCDAHAEGIRGILASIDANAMVTNSELQGIRAHLKKLNGTVAELQEESEKRAEVVKEFREHQKFGKWVHKNWWAVTLLVFVVIGVVMAIYDTVGLRRIMVELFNKL